MKTVKFLRGYRGVKTSELFYEPGETKEFDNDVADYLVDVQAAKVVTAATLKAELARVAKALTASEKAETDEVEPKAAAAEKEAKPPVDVVDQDAKKAATADKRKATIARKKAEKEAAK